jgi:hypothetical protein
MIGCGYAVARSGKHAETLLVGVFPEQRFGTRRIALADSLDDGVMAAMSTEQQIKCA